ncbi:IclR family transcriptional regulator [Microbacterium sp. G2-8]|uniref:IclR family transcriptional regulator n=1 Tax=Microbacterium sp. G2-8 TaxID=2842454 RepID=UPI001C89E207|nr:IclR family transcriptional regulator [Microbacterium sp. G2-8]
MTISEIHHPRTERMTAAQRVLAILEVFDQDHLVLSLSEISRRADLSLSTTHRLVGELKRWGALERSKDGNYAIGMRILELGGLEPQGLRLRDVARPYLGDLQQATNANVHLAVRDGHDVVYVESMRARQGARVLSRLGGRWPLHATGTGLVLLAFASPQFREEVLRSPLKRFTPKTIATADELNRRLAEVRRTSMAVVEDSITPDASAVAVPVRGPRDRLIAALGITVPSHTASPHSLLPALTSTARAISRTLGAPSAQGRPSTAA